MHAHTTARATTRVGGGEGEEERGAQRTPVRKQATSFLNHIFLKFSGEFWTISMGFITVIPGDNYYFGITAVVTFLYQMFFYSIGNFNDRFNVELMVSFKMTD